MMAFGLLTTAIIARRVPAEVFGEFVLMQVIASALSRVTSFGMTLSIARFVTMEEDERGVATLINTTLSFQPLRIILVGASVFLFRGALFKAFSLEADRTILIFILGFFVFESLRLVLEAILQGLFQFKAIAKSNLISSAAGFVLLVVLVLDFKLGLVGLVYSRLAAFCVSDLYLFSRIPVKWRLKCDIQTLKKLIKFGSPLQVNDVFSFLFGRLDTLVIGSLLGPSQIAYYELARKIPDSLGNLFNTYLSVFFSYLSRLLGRGERREASDLVNHSARLVSFCGLAVAVVTACFGREIIKLLFSAKFISVAPTFVVLSVAVTVTYLDSTLGYALVAAGDSGKPAVINTLHAAVSIACLFLLVPRFGIIGAAIATLAGFIAVVPLVLIFLRRRGVDTIPMDCVKPYIIFVASLLFVWLPPESFGWAGRVLGVALFVGLSLAWSVVRRSDIAAGLRELKIGVGASRLRWRGQAAA